MVPSDFHCIMHHYFYDDLGYKGIVSPGGENYYSYQQKNLLFIHLSSEHTTIEQKDMGAADH